MVAWSGTVAAGSDLHAPNGLEVAGAPMVGEVKMLDAIARRRR